MVDTVVPSATSATVCFGANLLSLEIVGAQCQISLRNGVVF